MASFLCAEVLSFGAGEDAEDKPETIRKHEVASSQAGQDCTPGATVTSGRRHPCTHMQPALPPKEQRSVGSPRVGEAPVLADSLLGKRPQHAASSKGPSGCPPPL